jgi:hypothetical protein
MAMPPQIPQVPDVATKITKTAATLVQNALKSGGAIAKALAKTYWNFDLPAQIAVGIVLVIATVIGLAKLGVTGDAASSLTTLVVIALILVMVASSFVHGHTRK